jgi:hypothetical protein
VEILRQLKCLFKFLSDSEKEKEKSKTFKNVLYLMIPIIRTRNNKSINLEFVKSAIMKVMTKIIVVNYLTGENKKLKKIKLKNN